MECAYCGEAIADEESHVNVGWKLPILGTIRPKTVCVECHRARMEAKRQGDV